MATGAFTLHTHFKKEDHKREHIIHVKVMMDNQAGGKNINVTSQNS